MSDFSHLLFGQKIQISKPDPSDALPLIWQSRTGMRPTDPLTKVGLHAVIAAMQAEITELRAYAKQAIEATRGGALNDAEIDSMWRHSCDVGGMTTQEFTRHFARTIESRILAQQGVVSDAWQPIETAPKDGLTLLLGGFNKCNKWRTMRGQWFSQAVIDDEWEDPDGFEEGWYETAVEPDVPNCWPIAPTNWQPLPPPPAIQAQAGEGGAA